MDVSLMGVCAALQRLGWDSADTDRPMLVVSPADYANASSIWTALGGAVDLWATPRLPEFAWFVSWRGRRVGSEGA